VTANAPSNPTGDQSLQTPTAASPTPSKPTETESLGPLSEAAKPAPPAKASDIPNFAAAPPSAEASPPKSNAPATEPESGKWVPIPNAGKIGSRDDRPTPRESPASTRVEPADAATVEPETQVETVAHTVLRGENFWTISRRYYGSGRYYMALWKANRETVSAPERLVVGATIHIPPPEALDPALIEPARVLRPAASAPSARLRRTSRPVAQDGAAPRSARRSSDVELALPIADPFSGRDGRASAGLDPTSDERERPTRPAYKVRPRDTLRSIAKTKLGDPHRADEIRALNEAILDERGEVIPGQLIELPPDAQ
jgi:nucleoid-associated protein YgaU